MPEPDALEQQLTLLAADVLWPDTPALIPAIGRRIRERQPRWFESRWAMAAAVAILAFAALVAYTPSREAIAHWFDLHTRFQQVPQLVPVTPLPPGPLGTRLGLGDQTTLPAARAAVQWPVLVPQALGEPDEAYLQQPPFAPPGGEVTLVYAVRPGIPASGQTGVSVLVTEARGKIDTIFFGKIIGPSTTIDEVSVEGHPGFWISGAPHEFFFDDVNGDVRNETLRLATNTLLLNVGGTIVRIEGDMTKNQALQIAASLA